MDKIHTRSATGDYGVASATGRYGAASAAGRYGVASAAGYQGAASATGYQGAASATGHQGVASATGRYSVALSCGAGGRAKGAEGSALFLVFRQYDFCDDHGKILHARAVIVGREGIKPDTWYELTAYGDVVEAA